MRSKRKHAVYPAASQKDEDSNRAKSQKSAKLPSDLLKLTESELIRRRDFNDAEREALYIAAGGRCEICGTRLDEFWEPDHIKPFHLGGETNVVNGQATCRHCNRAKGGRYEW